MMLGLTYGNDRSLTVAAETMQLICHTAYHASLALAVEKGVFPFFERDKYLRGRFIRALPKEIQKAIGEAGIRNSHLIAIAPAGTISLLAGNVSSGLEPVFAASYKRKVLNVDGEPEEFALTDYALALWRSKFGMANGLPDAFVAAGDLPVSAHLAMQAALQPFVDHSISKTINVPARCPFSEFRQIYDLAYDKGLKGCTVFRPNPVTGMVLSQEEAGARAPLLRARTRRGLNNTISKRRGHVMRGVGRGHEKRCARAFFILTQIMAAPFILSIDRHSKDKEAEMEPETFRQWLSERGCAFEAGKDTVRTHGHAHVIVHRGDRSAVLPGVGTKKQLDPRIVRQIVDELGLDWNELPGPASHV